MFWAVDPERVVKPKAEVLCPPLVSLRQADEGTPVAELCRKAGVPDATF